MSDSQINKSLVITQKEMVDKIIDQLNKAMIALDEGKFGNKYLAQNHIGVASGCALIMKDTL